jgi:aryl-alcohol dehydrogenase-like predicted oxidoreductase
MDQQGSTVGGAIPRRPLGRTGVQVSLLALGGSHLGDIRDAGVATRIVHEAIDAGVNFFDNAWEYHDGRSEMLLGDALAGRRDRVVLMTKVCTHGRDRRVALRQLDESLRRLRTDHLDLWQIHECVYDDDPDLHFAPGGVIEALDEAKRLGKARFVGFTGHKDPSIHLRMLAEGYPFDTVQLPLNCFDASFRSFERLVLPDLGKRGIAAIGMKSLGGGGYAVRAGVITAAEALRYAMSLPVATVVSGVDSPEVLRQNLAIARGLSPMTAEEMNALRARVGAEAADGRYELYKTTVHFDAKVGREQHGFPPRSELPL